MKFFSVCLLLALVSFSTMSCSNPTLEDGEVGYRVNSPIFLGERNEFIDVLVGPTSPGLTWRDIFLKKVSYRPNTVYEKFIKDEKGDSRILSKDEINMDTTVALILGFKGSPLDPSKYNEAIFKQTMRSYFENYYQAYEARYSKTVRALIRENLGVKNYADLRVDRKTSNEKLFTTITELLKDSPYLLIKVNVSNVNPPASVLEALELNKEAEISRDRQAMLLDKAMKREKVLKQQAKNVTTAMKASKHYLKWYELSIQEKYADSIGVIATKEGTNTVFFPFGSPVAVK